jgi:hypothetical protein
MPGNCPTTPQISVFIHDDVINGKKRPPKRDAQGRGPLA